MQSSTTPPAQEGCFRASAIPRTLLAAPSSFDFRHGSRRLILIAEQDKVVRELQAHFLERAGFAVEFADDGAAALERVNALLPELVITEILIGSLDGLTLCRRLREDSGTSHIPVIVFSILAAAPRAYEAGAKAYLRKPLVESSFIATVRQHITAQPLVTKEKQWSSL